jgi:hypothetical protein
VRRRVGEQMISACLVPTWSMEEEVWWCGGALLVVWDELDHTVKKKQPTSAQHMWERR